MISARNLNFKTEHSQLGGKHRIYREAKTLLTQMIQTKETPHNIGYSPAGISAWTIRNSITLMIATWTVVLHMNPAVE